MFELFSSIVTGNRHGLKTIESSGLESALKKEKLVWVDIEKPTREDAGLLKSMLNLHPLAVDDCLQPFTRARFEEYDGALFIVSHMASYRNHRPRFIELDLFIGKNFVLTFHREPVDAITSLRERLSKNPRLLDKGPDFLAYLLLAEVVETYFSALDSLEDKADQLEDRIFANPDRKTISKVFDIKAEVLRVRKIAAPQRDVLSHLSRADSGFITQANTLYFRDVHDHSIRVNDSIETLRETVASLLEVYASMVSYKLNETMKVLTVIATIMLPLTLITGIYGMNFAFMPELHSEWGLQYGYAFALSLMVVIAAVMLYYFRRKSWI